MIDWKGLGRKLELRKRLLKSQFSVAWHRIQIKRCNVELRVLLWYLDKLETVKTLAESYRFQHRDGDDTE